MKLELTHLIDVLPGLVWTALPDGRAQFLNQRWCDYTGLRLDEAVGFGWQSAIHPQDLALLLEGWRSLLASGRPGELEGRLRRYDGEYRRFLFSASPITDPLGQIVHWCGINTDIEDRRQAQEMLHAAEHRSRMILDGLPTMVALMTPEGTFDQGNRHLLDYLGCSLEELRTRTLGYSLHPNDREEVLSRWRHSVETGAPYDVEARMRSGEGVYRWFLTRGRPLRDETGRITVWYLLHSDLDERRRGEEMMAEAQRLSQTGSFTSDPIANKLVLSDELYRIHEFEPGSGANIERMRSLVHPEDQLRYDEVIERSRAGHDFNLVYRIVTASGKLKYLHGVGHLVDRFEGRPFFVGAAQDVTEATLAEEALRARERDLSAIVDAIPAGAALMSPSGSLEVANQPILEYFGHSFEELETSEISQMVHPDDMPHVMEAVRHSLATGAPYDIEERLRRADGVYHWFDVRGRPIRDAEGRIVRWYVLYIDIDERKRAEEALRASERYSRLVIDSIPALIAVFTATGAVELVNQQVIRYFGLDVKALEHWDSNETTHPEDRAQVVERFSRAIGSGEPFEIEVRARRFDGTYRWFQSLGAPLRDDEGKIVRWYNLLIDIDERKRAEEALKSSERELARTHYHLTEGQRLSHTASFTAYPQVDKHTWSEEFYRICDFETGSIATLGRMREIVHADDVERFDTVVARGIEGHDFDLIFRIVTPKGVVKYLHGVGRVVEQSADGPLFVGAIQDITDSKLAEQSLKTREAELRRAHFHLTEAQRLSRSGSFITDLVRDEHLWSDELYRIFDFEPGSKVTTQRVQNLVHPEDLATFQGMIARALGGEEPEFSFRIVTARGTVKHIHGIAHLTEQVTGRSVFVGALQDVTAARMAEDALTRARAELTHVSRTMTLGTLAASIAHEVNQPLTGIITNASTCLRMLAADPPNIEGVRATVQRALRDGNRASDVIRNLRNLFSRKPARNEPVDLKDAAQEVLALSSNELRRSQVIVRTEFAANLPRVMGDRVQLQQVILNLVLNAADAMLQVDDRPRDLLVATSREDSDQVQLWVRDTGIGIEPHNTDKLFEAFFSTKSEGMGIGLSISRSIIESHSGRLWASGNSGAGATFSFALPCEAEHLMRRPEVREPDAQ
jgi:PAS domain S-box-containing protein